jgi:hypothetical protein
VDGVEFFLLPMKFHFLSNGKSYKDTHREREREREREIQIVHSASLAYEDESVFMFCALLRMAVRQWLTAF